MSTAYSATEPQQAFGEAGRVPVLSIRNLKKKFVRTDGAVVPAIDDVSLDLYPGEFLVLLGPSGCGKTTLLRAVAGLERPDEGVIDVHGAAQFSSLAGVNLPPERRRNVSMVFQSYALWPHMTAGQNVAYPLQSIDRRHRPSKAVIRQRVLAALEKVGIPELSAQYSGQMSGGQQQRVALARALVSGSDLVLFDEPLSNVDAKVRDQLRLELLILQKEIGFSALFVTHDQTEAMVLGNRIVVLQQGRIAQVGTPKEVYNAPSSRYVADFVGSINQLTGVITSITGNRAVVETAIGPVVGTCGDEFRNGQDVIAVWRPEKCRLSPGSSTDGLNSWTGTVVATYFLGAMTEVVVDINGQKIRTSAAGDVEPPEAPCLSVSPDDVRVLATGEVPAG